MIEAQQYKFTTLLITVFVLFISKECIAVIANEPCYKTICSEYYINGLETCVNDENLFSANITLCNGLYSGCFKKTFKIPSLVSDSGWTCFSRTNQTCDETRSPNDKRNGDTYYCSEQPYGVSCTLNESPCFCKKGQYSYKRVCMNDNGEYLDASIILTRIGMKQLNYRMPGPQTHRIDDESNLIMINNNDMILTCPFNKPCSALIHLEKNPLILTCNNTCVYPRNQNNSFLPLHYSYKVVQDGVTYTGNSSAPGKDFCDTIDCLFCMESIDYPECLALWEKVVFYFVLILLVLLITVVPCIILICICTCCVKLTKYTHRKYKDHKFKKVGNEKKAEDLKKGTLPPPSKWKSKYSLAMTVLFMGMVLACDQGISIQSENVVCSIGVNEEICTYTISTVVSLDLISQTACLAVYDKDGNYLDTLTISYDSFINRAASTLDFYTSDWETEHEEDGECAVQTEGCGINYCNKVNNGEIKTPAGIPDYYSNYPQFIRCDIKTWESCFWSEGCNYNSWIVKPTGPVQKSYKHSSVIAMSKINYIMTNITGTAEVSQGAIVTDTYGDTTFKLTLNGWLGSTVLLNTQSFSNVFYPSMYVDSSAFKGSTVLGTLYELQASNEYDLINHSPNNLLHAEFCTYGAINWESSVITCAQSRFKNSNGLRKLPLETADGLVTFTVEQDSLKNIIGYYNKGPGILLSVEVRGAKSVRAVKACENSFKFISASGCYSCETGTELILTSNLEDDCIWLVSSETLEIITQTVTSISPITILTHPTSASNKHKIYLKNGSFSTYVNVEFVSGPPEVELNPYINYNTSNAGTDIDEDDDGFDLFGGIFETWVQYVFYAVVGIVVIILLLFCCIGVSKIIL